jgi:hypothetical protein
VESLSGEAIAAVSPHQSASATARPPLRYMRRLSLRGRRMLVT